MTASDDAPAAAFPPWPITDDAVREAMAGLLADGSWGRYHGPHCEQLKAGLQSLCGVEHVHLCSSGTSAVELALRAAGVGPGDEVILAAYDYKANFVNILSLQATPVLVETLSDQPVMEPAEVARAITAKTRAIVCSHLHGSSAPVVSLRTLADAHRLTLIEDACQASGATLDGRPAGTLGHLGTFSFGGSKLLTAGRGGAVLTADAVLAQRIRVHTHRGNDAYPLSELQAAVLNAQLPQLADRTRQRQRAAERFLQQLRATEAVVPACGPADWSPANQPGLYKLALLWQPDEGREHFCEQARAAGVALDPGFPALHRIHARRRFRAVGELINADGLHERLMILHHPLLLRPDAEVKAAADRLVALAARLA